MMTLSHMSITPSGVVILVLFLGALGLWSGYLSRKAERSAAYGLALLAGAAAAAVVGAVLGYW